MDLCVCGKIMMLNNPVSYTISLTADFRNQGDKVSDETKQTQEVKAKRTAKNSVF